MTLNIASYSDDWRARLLSTFARTAFVLVVNGYRYRCESVEGFWQGLKFSEGSPDRLRVFGLWGLQAKLAGAEATPSQEIEFAGRRIRRGGTAHHEVAEIAMRAKLEQNPEVRQALQAPDGHRLTHELVDDRGQPVPDSLTLPSAVFCAIWTRLCAELLTAPPR